MMSTRVLGLVVVATAVFACGNDGDRQNPPDPDASVVDPPKDSDAPFHYLAELPRGEEQRAALCARQRDDRLRRWYCAGASAPTIDGIAGLLAGVQLGEDGFPPNGDRFSAAAHSTALQPLHATVLNPRVVFMSKFDETEFISTIFTRGEFVVEVAAKDLARNTINFYLVVYRLGCLPNCSNADRHLEAADSAWRDVSVYAEADLHNTALDCLRCHVPAGGNSTRILRMHELDIPWTHWMFPPLGSGALATQFLANRPAGERYASLPVNRIAEDGSPRDLQTFIGIHNETSQPNQFDGFAINNDDPSINQPNAVWLALYENAKQGIAIDAPPYFGISPFDNARVSAAGTIHKAVAAGTMPSAAMPDLTRELFASDDVLRFIGYKPAAGLAAKGIINHTCGPCHDGRFPGITRDKFRISAFPDGLETAEKDAIASRLSRMPNDPRLMPPIVAGELTPEEIQIVRTAMGL